MDEQSFKRQWTMENMDKFINLYRQHECLWNPESDGYKNCQLKKSALYKIVVGMRMEGLTVTIAKDRIKSIRTMYRRELNKVIKSTSTATNEKYIYRPKLFWFQQIDEFLRPIAVSRMDTSNVGCRPSNTTSQTTEANEDSDDNLYLQEQKIEEYPTEDNLNTEIEDQRQTSISYLTTEQIGKKRKHSLHDLHSFADTRLVENTHLEECEFDIFGKFVSTQLKRLPLLTALQCQQKIQAFLTSKRIELLENQKEQRTSRMSLLGGVSPFSGSINSDCEEKPDVAYLESLN